MTEQGSTESQHPGDGAHQGPGRWARRGAERLGMPAGESASDEHRGQAPTADDVDPDISPSLAGGHAGSSRRDLD